MIVFICRSRTSVLKGRGAWHYGQRRLEEASIREQVVLSVSTLARWSREPGQPEKNCLVNRNHVALFLRIKAKGTSLSHQLKLDCGENLAVRVPILISHKVM